MTPHPAHWEHFPHGADVGVRGLGTSRSEAFEQAAVAMTAVVTDPDSIEPRERVDMACSAPDDELLLVDWLNAIVYEMATRGMVFGRYAVELDASSLKGSAWGEPMDPGRHLPIVELKGATYTSLRVARTDDGGWVAQCVVDV